MSDHTHSVEAERSILAPILDGRDQTAWTEAIEIIRTPLAFWVRAHQVVAVACEGLTAAGSRIDAQTVAAWLGDHSWGEVYDRLRELAGETGRRPKASDGQTSYEDSALAEVGGYPAIGELASAWGARGAIAQQAKIVAAHYRQRQAIAEARKLTEALEASGGARKTNDLVGSAVDQFAKIVEGNAVASSLSQGIADTLTRHDEIQGGTRSVRSASWGIGVLDEKAPLDPGTVWTLAAAPSAGKTSLALHIAEATSRRFGPGSVQMVSREMGIRELSSVILARALRCGRWAIDKGRLTVPQRDQCAAVQKEVEAWNIDVRDTFDCTAKDATTWVQSRHRATGGQTALLIVDHIGILTEDYPKQDDYQKITRATAAFKNLARSLGIAVVLLCQMNRGGRKAERTKSGALLPDPEPQLADLKGSGSVEQDSDGVLFLYRQTLELTNQGARQITAKIAKNRAGPLAHISLEFWAAEGQRFVSSLPPAHEPRDEDKPTRHERMHGGDPIPEADPVF